MKKIFSWLVDSRILGIFSFLITVTLFNFPTQMIYGEENLSSFSSSENSLINDRENTAEVLKENVILTSEGVKTEEKSEDVSVLPSNNENLEVFEPPVVENVTDIPAPTQMQNFNKNRLAPEIDDITGALIYKYDIIVPPGRNEMTPDISVVYNSASVDRNSIIGTGWNLNIPYIERINKIGSDKLYLENYFSSSLDGELVLQENNFFVAKDENGSFLNYEFNNNAWIVKDKKGTIYRFGTTIASRQDDPSDDTKVFRWMLDEMRDTNGNYITYEYFKDNGQIYPSQITYTNNSDIPGVFEIFFELEPRTNVSSFYNTGFLVKSNYRINEIRTEINDAWVRKYNISYTTGDHNFGSFLDSIIESGQDEFGNIITLPAMDFNYTTSVPGWTYDPNIILPVPITNSSEDFGMRTADINGDGLIDIVCHGSVENAFCSEWNPKIFLNTGVGWIDVSNAWELPNRIDNPYRKESFVNEYEGDTGLRIIDVNGDMKADLVRGRTQYKKYVYINNGVSGWDYNPNWHLPLLGFISDGDYGFRMADINGDNLPDVVCRNNKTNGTCSRNNPTIFLNTGTDWVDVSTTWNLPVIFATENGYDTGVRIFDINADGLNDLIYAIGDTKDIYLNNGSGWTYDPSLTFPLQGFVMNSSGDYSVRMADINGDNLPDVVCHNEVNNITCGRYDPRTILNTGTGWLEISEEWPLPYKADNPNIQEAFLGTQMQDASLRVLDLNGDGIDDMTRAYGPEEDLRFVYMSNGSVQSNLLNEVNYPEGGGITVEYKAVQLFKDNNNLLNSKMPITSYVVSKITTRNGQGLNNVNTYEYQGGEYRFNNFMDHKFVGFSKIIKTDSAGNKTINYYHQGNETDSANGEYEDHISKVGKIYRTEVFDSSNNLFSLTVNKWGRYEITSDHNFIKLLESIDFYFDGNSDHKDKAISYIYDNTNGNLIEKTEWGEVVGSDDGNFSDIGIDKIVTTINYAQNIDANIFALPSREVVVNIGESQVRENKYYYDLQSFGEVIVGNLTKQEMWLRNSDYIDIEKTYNSYGLIISEKDARDKTTYFTYDEFNLYPTIITNALSQSMQYIYDYSVGKPKTIIDVNNKTFETLYDGLDRVLAEKQPDLSNPNILVDKKTYTYTDIPNSISVFENNFLDNSNSFEIYIYYDGLGRQIQTRKEMEDGNYSVTDKIYNERGLLEKESLPYFSSGSAKTMPTTDDSLLTTYTYDSLMRVINTSNAVGNTVNTYNDWILTVTDPMGKIKDFTKDAFGNLIQIREHNNQEIYTTEYEYDNNNKLARITDALGNVRYFTNDGLGRRLTAEDLHKLGDETFGVWHYIYDPSGNVISITDPNEQVVNYTYDDLNRISSEDYIGQDGIEVSYIYDTGPNSVGRLSQVSALTIKSAYSYDSLGNISREEKTIPFDPIPINQISLTDQTPPGGGIIAANAFQTFYTYDRQGNKLSISNHDGSNIKYFYNTAGQLESIQRKETTDGVFINVVDDFDYGPHEKIIYQRYANGGVINNIFDERELYRLRNKISTANGRQEIQNLTYTYDPNGNIVKIVDVSNTDTFKTVDYIYDDLNRLISATATDVAQGQTPYTHTYSYNAIGNILTRTDISGNYIYNGNQGSNYANPHAVTNIGSINYTYDHNGNLLTETGGMSNTWDYRNRLKQTTINGVISNYYYDHTVQRVKSSNGTTSIYYPSKYYTTDRTNATKYIYAGEVLVATVKGSREGANIYYLYTDHLNSINASTDNSGNLVNLFDYYPFGNKRISSGTDITKKQFISQYFDNTTNLNYLNARYYQATQGHFISQDPMFWKLTEDLLMDPQQLNSYSYARNNPINGSDPEGLKRKEKTERKSIKESIKSFFSRNAQTKNSQRLFCPAVGEKNTEKTTTWDSITDQRIRQLDSRIQQSATNFINNTESELGIQLRATSTYRSIEEQNILYQQGRTTPGNIVTQLEGGESSHNFRLAMDVVIMENNKPNWQKQISPPIADIAKREGFSWGGDWKTFKDSPHFENMLGQSLGDLLKVNNISN